MLGTVVIGAADTLAAAGGKRGVSMVVVPDDMNSQRVVDTTPSERGGLLLLQPFTVPTTTELDHPTAGLNGDGDVRILCGSKCVGAQGELQAFDEWPQPPMVHAIWGKEHVERDSVILNGRADEILDLPKTNLWR